MNFAEADPHRKAGRVNSKNPGVVVVVARVRVAQPHDARVELVVQGLAKAWINGDPLAAAEPAPQADSQKRDADSGDAPHSHPIHLHEGINTLVVKVAGNDSKKWSLTLRLTDEAGQPLPLLPVDAEPEGQ